MNVNPMFLIDGYKSGHGPMFPDKTEKVYSNFTNRQSRIPGVDFSVVFAIQAFCKEILQDQWNTQFFGKDRAEVVEEYQALMDAYLGPGAVKADHIGALHDLGYLPIHLKALPEGTLCPIKVPMLTITNTKPEFFWLTNYLETMLSCYIWHPITSATQAFMYRRMLEHYAKITSDMPEFVPWQIHDFSMRGHTSPESATRSGAGHLLSSTGTDTIPSILFLKQYYGADFKKELVGGSVTATEHAVMCMGGKESELETFNRLITQVKPEGIISIVSDTWDFWHVLTDTAVKLKDKIMSRPGKVVFRPDSGDPVKIVCGNPVAEWDSPQASGAVRVLWNIFGGTTNSKGYRQLDSHVGLIYGDSITHERCGQISQKLYDNKFASTNMVYGVGSYTYQYVTRDTLGGAMKATYGVIDGKPVDIFKDPKTDSGFKKSAKGLLCVNADLTLSEQVSVEDEQCGLLQTVFLDGRCHNFQNLSEIRARLMNYL